MKLTKSMYRILLLTTIVSLITACSDGGSSSGGIVSSKQKTSGETTQEQINATKIATEFIDAIKESPDLAGQPIMQDKWITPGTRVDMSIKRYLAALAYKYQSTKEIDGLGLAELSNNIGEITYRHGAYDCKLFFVKTSRGWRITSTNCNNLTLHK